MLPENCFHRALLFVATIILVMCYSWLGSRLMAPSISLPQTLVSETVWIDADGAHRFKDVHGRLIRETSFIKREVEKLESPMKWLGRFEPVVLVIDSTNSNRLMMTDVRIEVGSSVALARGQLRKAFLKSWLLQNAGRTITSSHLRLDIASDLLLAILDGKLALETPFGQSLEYSEVAHWSQFAQSYESLCASRWQSVDLAALCKPGSSPQIGTAPVSLHSLRPLIGAIVYRALQSGSVVERMKIAREWVDDLSSDYDEAKLADTTLRTKVLHEIGVLLPKKFSESSSVAASLADSLSRAGLNGRGEIDADLIVAFEAGNKLPLESLKQAAETTTAFGVELKKRSVVLVERADDYVVVPGFAQIPKAELKIAKTKYFVKFVCNEPSVAELTRELPKDAQSLIVKKCALNSSDRVPFAALLRAGVPAFSRLASNLSFYQPRKDGIQLAMKRGAVKPNERLLDLVQNESSKRQGLFGSEMKKWDAKVGAYRMKGPLEIIPWFRGERTELPKSL